WHGDRVAGHGSVGGAAIETHHIGEAGIGAHNGAAVTEAQGDLGVGGTGVAEADGEGVGIAFDHGVTGNTADGRGAVIVGDLGGARHRAIRAGAAQRVVFGGLKDGVISGIDLHGETVGVGRHCHFEGAVRIHADSLRCPVDGDGDFGIAEVHPFGGAIAGQCQRQGCGAAGGVAQVDVEGVGSAFDHGVTGNAADGRG
ncbi:hypothetical protein, partial [Shewanella indica]|uniref:hypothetical protein n=1 Tax=Shewanella indica TaxID=768528 RepID=UPI001CFEEA3D